MKKYILIVFVTFLNLCFSQNENLILEDYIQKKISINEVSRLPLSNEILKKYIRIYVKDEYNSMCGGEEAYKIVTNQFDWEKLENSDLKIHNFIIKVGKRKFKKQRFTEPILSKDKNYAIFYVGEKCRKGLCGGGSLILMEKVDNKWKEKAVLFAWIS